MSEIHEGSSLEQTLLHGKVGGIPTWGIGVMLAGLLTVGLYLRNRNKSTATVANTASDNTGGQIDPNAIDPATGLTYGAEAPAGYGLPAGAIGDWLSQNPTGSQYPVGLPEQGLPGPVTNQQWSRLAFDSLVAKGDDPTLVGNALAKFLAGTTLTQAEQSIVNLAETMFGAPPEGLIPINTTPSPTPSPSPSPSPWPVDPGTHIPGPTRTPAGQTGTSNGNWVDHIGRWPAWNGSLWGIAAYRSKPSQAGVNDLYQANRDAIEAAARAHGRTDSQNGRYVYEGTPIIVPWLTSDGHHLY